MTATTFNPAKNPHPWEKLHHIEKILDDKNDINLANVDKYLAVLKKDYADVKNGLYPIKKAEKYLWENPLLRFRLIDIKDDRFQKERARLEATETAARTCC